MLNESWFLDYRGIIKKGLNPVTDMIWVYSIYSTRLSWWTYTVQYMSGPLKY